jgi:hypothetical protein
MLALSLTRVENDWTKYLSLYGIRSQDSEVGVPTKGWKPEGSEFESLYGQDFPLFHIGQVLRPTHTQSVPGVLSPGVERPGR